MKKLNALQRALKAIFFFIRALPPACVVRIRLYISGTKERRTLIQGKRSNTIN